MTGGGGEDLQKLTIPHLLLGLSITLVWGMNFVVIKAALDDIGPLSLISLRFVLLACLLLIPAFGRLNRSQFRSILIFALVFGAMHHGLMIVGTQHVNASIAAVLIQTGVPIALLISVALDATRPNLAQIFGVACAIVGTALLTNLSFEDTSLVGVLILLGSASAWAVGNRMRIDLKGLSALQITIWSSALAAPVLLICAIGFEDLTLSSVFQMTPKAVLALAFLTVISSLFNVASWWYLVRKYRFIQIAPFFLASPVVGVLLSVWLLGDILTWLQALGVVISVIALIAIEVFRPKQHAKEQPA